MNKELVRKEYENSTVNDLCHDYMREHKKKTSAYDRMEKLAVNDTKGREDLFLDWAQISVLDQYHQAMWRCEIIAERIWVMAEIMKIKAPIHIKNSDIGEIMVIIKEKKITVIK